MYSAESVQSRSGGWSAPAGPVSSMPLLLRSIQNWYCGMPLGQTGTDEPPASSKMTWPGPPLLGVEGSSARFGVTELHAAQTPATGVLMALSTERESEFERACGISTSSMYQPSSCVTLSCWRRSSYVWVSPTSIDVARNRMRILRAANAERL